MGLRMNKFIIFWGSLKNLIFRGEGYKKQFLGGGVGCEKLI